MTRPAVPTVGGEPVSPDTPARRAPPATGRAPCGPRQGPGSANRPCKCRSGNVLHVKPNLTIFNRLGHLDHRAPVRVVDPRSYPGPLARDRQRGVLRELVDIAAVGNGGPSDEVLGAILEREKQFPTGIGYGVAVPHGKTPVLSCLVVVAGTTPAPVPYETIDGQPVRLFFLLAGPESAAGAHVKALSRISRLVRREQVRCRLLDAPSPEEFYRAVCEAAVPSPTSVAPPSARLGAASRGRSA